jgi:hypothetical protein
MGNAAPPSSYHMDGVAPTRLSAHGIISSITLFGPGRITRQLATIMASRNRRSSRTFGGLTYMAFLTGSDIRLAAWLIQQRIARQHPTDLPPTSGTLQMMTDLCLVYTAPTPRNNHLPLPLRVFLVSASTSFPSCVSPFRTWSASLWGGSSLSGDEPHI